MDWIFDTENLWAVLVTLYMVVSGIMQKLKASKQKAELAELPVLTAADVQHTPARPRPRPRPKVREQVYERVLAALRDDTRASQTPIALPPQGPTVISTPAPKARPAYRASRPQGASVTAQEIVDAVTLHAVLSPRWGAK